MFQSRKPGKVHLAQALLAAFLFFVFTGGHALATWSIVVTNLQTGEVAVGSATCLQNFALKKYVGVIVVGKGAAQAQASVDIGQNRITMANGLMAGLTAQEILDELKLTDPQLQDHQYGIAELLGGSATFSGSQNASHASGVTGQVGSIVYAIQGNILTGQGVIQAAEDALIFTPGDLGEKMMAAMHGAKSMGGDGRCSCHNFFATACGCPPYNLPSISKQKEDHKWKSAHCAYLVIARVGDLDGVFNKFEGFANGSYYLDLNVNGTPDEIDPVDRLQKRYKKWRKAWKGRPDHILTEKIIYPQEILGDGVSQAELMIALIDLENKRIPHGDAVITVTHAVESAGASAIGDVIDHGDGTYSVPLLAGHTAGTDIFRIEVGDRYATPDQRPITLYPFPTLEVKAPSLAADVDGVSARVGDAVHFDLAGGSGPAGRDYVILGSASGTDPGYWIRHIHVPLNPDLFSRYLAQWIASSSFPAGVGTLDSSGKASAPFDPVPGQLLPFVGMDLHFAWTTTGPVDFVSNPVKVSVQP